MGRLAGDVAMRVACIVTKRVFSRRNRRYSDSGRHCAANIVGKVHDIQALLRCNQRRFGVRCAGAW